MEVYQLFAHGRWFSPASSTTKIGRHNIAESGAKHQKSIKLQVLVYFTQDQRVQHNLAMN